MAGLSPAHLIFILVVALVVLGPNKLPETGAALGRAIREFRHAVDGMADAATPTAKTPVPTPASLSPVVAPATDESAPPRSDGPGPI